MKKTTHLISFGLVTASLALSATAFAADDAGKKAKVCPISGKPVDPAVKTEYEGVSYAFCCTDCQAQFAEDRENSLYQKIGGKAAIDAAVDLFYTKVLADARVNHFFDDVSMKRQHAKQKAFLSAAFGSPVPYEGKDMRAAHAQLELTDEHFGAIAGHLQATLTELKVDEALIAQVMAIAASTKDDVLNRKKAE